MHRLKKNLAEPVVKLQKAAEMGAELALHKQLQEMEEEN